MKRLWQISARASKRPSMDRARATKLNNGDTSSRVWNSLEAAKIGVSILTALSVVGLGVIVTRTNTEDERAYQAQLRGEARKAERLARLDAQAREERLARAAQDKARSDRFDTQIREERRTSAAEAIAARDRVAVSLEAKHSRDETFARERALRDEAFARELALRREANLREDEIRAEDRARSIAEGVYNRRREAWTSFS